MVIVFLIEYQANDYQNDDLCSEEFVFGGTKLTTTDFNQLYEILPPYCLDVDEFHILNKDELVEIQKHMDDQIEVDFTKYEYHVTVGIDD